MTSEPKVFLSGKVHLKSGDCLEILPQLDENSVDAAVLDPPYHLASIVKRWSGNGPPPVDGVFRRGTAGFMGKQWDGGDIAFRPETWVAVLRVLKPGGHLLAFAAPKNSHRMVCAIEDAGFEIRDDIQYLLDSGTHARNFMASLSEEQMNALYLAAGDCSFLGRLHYCFGSGFPKSLSVGKAIDKAAGAEREVVGANPTYRSMQDVASAYNLSRNPDITAPATDAARQWEGWGSALKPAYEPICLTRKPLDKGLGVAGNVLRWGTGALNIDKCRIESGIDEDLGRNNNVRLDGSSYIVQREAMRIDNSAGKGRWPANVIHDGSPEVVGAFPETGLSSGGRIGTKDTGSTSVFTGDNSGLVGKYRKGDPGFGDGGSAARYFYTAKADQDDRLGSKHPTIKPISLIRYLAKLVTPPGGTILDCFAGSGTLGEAAYYEGFNAILIEREPEYLADIERRMSLALSGPDERARESIKARLVGKPVDAGPLFGVLA